MSRKLYVGNLPYEVGETELQELFGRAGSVESVNVMRDQATGRARGFAFVEMSTDEEAQQAITALNGTQVGGRNLTVNEARPKPERSGGGFGGGQRRHRGSAVPSRRPKGARPHGGTGAAGRATRRRMHGPHREAADRATPRIHPSRERSRDLFPSERPRGWHIVQ